MKIYSFIFLLICLSMSVKGKEPLNRYSLRGLAQGTDYSIVYYHPKELIKTAEIAAILNAVDSSLSIYNPHSSLVKFNKMGLGSMEVDTHFQQVFLASQHYYNLTGGLFDITIAPLIQAWGFGPKRIKVLPTQQDINAILPAVGLYQVKLHGKHLQKENAATQLDVNGIAQGYSVDLIADYLASKGISSFIVELGGEMRIQGVKPKREKFTVAMERPVHGEHGVELKESLLYLRKGAMTTAGNLEKYYFSEGQKVTHHINPKTGYTFVTPIISATVYANTAMEADALDNYMMSLSPQEAIKFANKRKNFEVYIVYKDSLGAFQELQSKGFHKFFKK